MNLATPNGVEYGLGTGVVRPLAGPMNRSGLTRTVGFTHGYSDFTPSGCAREAYGFSQTRQSTPRLRHPAHTGRRPQRRRSALRSPPVPPPVGARVRRKHDPLASSFATLGF